MNILEFVAKKKRTKTKSKKAAVLKEYKPRRPILVGVNNKFVSLSSYRKFDVGRG